MATPTIKVVLGSDIKREAVLIDPNISAAEPTFGAGSPSTMADAPNNIIATGANSRSILKRIYGR